MIDDVVETDPVDVPVANWMSILIEPNNVINRVHMYIPSVMFNLLPCCDCH